MMEAKRFLNILDLVGVCFVLFFAFGVQILLHEQPCPLCILQRLAWIGVGVGILLNLRFGISSRHYSISLLAAIIGAAVSVRQILLHIVPGQAAFGAPILGIHLYTWSFLGFVAMMLYLVLLLYLGAK